LLKKNATINRWRWGILALGAALCLIGAVLMVHGSILGERTVNIATVVSIIGIGIIPHANRRIMR
jgi:hypothetical protein